MNGTTGRGGTVTPTPPDDIVEAARLAPDHWISMIDPGWDGEGVPPDRVVVGRWRTGTTGEIEEWEDNEAYRPSPEALGWPEPTDDVDHALQLAVTGYGPVEDALRALATAEVAVLTLPDGSPVTAAVEGGRLVVPVFTAAPHLDSVGAFAFERVTVPALLDRLPAGHALYVNPAGPAGTVLEPGRLAGTTATAAVPAHAS
ncbi:type VII secretion system-associated protein [Streptomyces sp. MA15]|uniref:type VII secretion system-associated protein n=1 Tax=Streptomyces sp. MA15 TaxID=3055061 RepID=UPI0025B1B74A|nr:type VII secretion system-associated protein [Streptomyces sp. MA15]MDN3271141.1 type VII secretion system-associated protein [Streptomyces sp. MA15]